MLSTLRAEKPMRTNGYLVSNIKSRLQWANNCQGLADILQISPGSRLALFH